MKGRKGSALCFALLERKTRVESPKGKERARVFGDISKERKVADIQVADIQWLIRAGSRAGIILIAFTTYVLGKQAT